MPGFGPVASTPVASIGGSGTSGTNYNITPGHVTFGGLTPAVSMIISGPRVTWAGAEILHTGSSSARLTWIGTEVLHTGASKSRVTWFGVEVLRSVTQGSPAKGFVSIIWGQ
jgi:hypothetical protein